MTADLAGCIAVVTGGGRGIGRAIAAELADCGAVVFSLDLSHPQPLAGVTSIDADVASAAGVEEAFQVVAARGPIGVLVNNAGLFAGLERRPFWELEAEEWDRVMTVNARSAFLCSKAAAGPMRERSWGRIVNLASGSVSFGMAGLLHYVTSKAAIVGMTRSLARELGPAGVTVNAVAPGLVSTEVTEMAIDDGYRARIAESQMIAEPLAAADVAAAVSWLCSPDARLVTGQTLLVNGGATVAGL